VLANFRSFRYRVSYNRDSSPVIVSGFIVLSFLLFIRLRVFTGYISVAVIVIILNPFFIVSLLEYVELYRSLVYSLRGITSSGLVLPPGIRAIVFNYKGVPFFFIRFLYNRLLTRTIIVTKSTNSLGRSYLASSSLTSFFNP
jgi:hypothetical protein